MVNHRHHSSGTFFTFHHEEEIVNQPDHLNRLSSNQLSSKDLSLNYCPIFFRRSSRPIMININCSANYSFLINNLSSHLFHPSFPLFDYSTSIIIFLLVFRSNIPDLLPLSPSTSPSIPTRLLLNNSLLQQSLTFFQSLFCIWFFLRYSVSCDTQWFFNSLHLRSKTKTVFFFRK